MSLNGQMRRGTGSFNRLTVLLNPLSADSNRLSVSRPDGSLGPHDHTSYMPFGDHDTQDSFYPAHIDSARFARRATPGAWDGPNGPRIPRRTRGLNLDPAARSNPDGSAQSLISI